MACRGVEILELGVSGWEMDKVPSPDRRELRRKLLEGEKSSPGPEADDAFLDDLRSKLANLPNG